MKNILKTNGNPMWATNFALFLVIAIMFYPAFGAGKPSQKCNVGPIKKTYGKTPWLVYSCNNDKTEGKAAVVLVSAPGNPAMPFVFFFYVKDGGYRLHGEGTGSKNASGAALSELKQLTEPDITGLIAQTKRVHKKK